MNYCTSCGSSNAADARFCNKCGAAIAVATTAAVKTESVYKAGTAPNSPPVEAEQKAKIEADKKKADEKNVVMGCGGLVGILVIIGVIGSFGWTGFLSLVGIALILFGIFKGKRVAWMVGAGAIACAIGLAVFSPQEIASSSTSSGASPSAVADVPTPKPLAAATDRPTPKPRPTATPESYEHQRLREKQEFYATVEQSVTADKIAGNPSKYVGSNVELHCTVSNVPQPEFFNAACGEDGTNIVVKYGETNNLDQGQSVRILGTVDDPMDGTNSFGGTMSFPTVDAKFLQ